MTATSGLTVLRTLPTARATKEWRWNQHLQQWSMHSYAAGGQFFPEEMTFVGIDGLAAVMERVQADAHALIVRGALTDAVRRHLMADPDAMIRRRKLSRGGVPGTLVEVDRDWIMVDIDSWPLPTWADLADDPELVIDAAVRDLLPEPFHDARAWWQLSSSAGFVTDVLKVHVFYMLAEPASNEMVKAVLKQHAPGVDRSPFSAAQLHYVAAPIIECGHDPLPRRTGWLRGLSEVVKLPSVELHPDGTPTDTGRLPPGDIGAALSVLGHGDGKAGFHEPLRTATLRYARQCVRHGDRDDEALKNLLRVAIRSAPVRPGVQRQELERYCQDGYLQPMIDGAVRLVRTGDAATPTMRPHYTAPTADVAACRREVRREIATFFDRVRRGHANAEIEPEHAALSATVGVGKTRLGCEELPDHVAVSRVGGLPHRVTWFVPEHALSDQTFRDMQAAGIHAAVWRGREADNPYAPDETMCRNMKPVRQAQRIRADAETVVCGKPGETGACPFRESCAYQNQKGIVAAADVVIAANAMMYRTPPTSVLSDQTGLIVADEKLWQAGLDLYREMEIGGFATSVIASPVLTQGKWQRVDMSGTDALHTWASRLIAGVERLPVGALVRKADLVAAGLTADDCRQARALEWRRERSAGLRLGLVPDQWTAALRDAAVNSDLPSRAAVWSAAAALLAGDSDESGHLQRGETTDGQAALWLHTRRDICEAVASRPMLLLDGTMPLDIVRRFLPRVRLLSDVQARAPCMTVNQIIGGWGKTSLVQSDKATAAENERRASMIKQLQDFVSLHGGGNAGVITYKAIEREFSDLRGVQTGHFNAIAGSNRFSAVDNIFIIGRPLARPEIHRVMAMALTGRPIAPQQPHQASRGVLLADGTGLAMQVRVYADPDAEAVRAAVTDAEIVQAIGRGRGVNRDSSRPLTVWLLADVVVPMPVDDLVRWQDVRLTPLARMLAREAALLSPRDACRAYPDLVGEKEEAAKKALQRCTGEDFGDIPLWKGNHRGLSPKSAWEVTYRPNGRGQQNRRALVMQDRLATFRGWLEAIVGQLACYEVRPTDLPGAGRRATPPAYAPEIAALSGAQDDAGQQTPLRSVALSSGGAPFTGALERWGGDRIETMARAKGTTKFVAPAAVAAGGNVALEATRGTSDLPVYAEVALLKPMITWHVPVRSQCRGLERKPARLHPQAAAIGAPGARGVGGPVYLWICDMIRDGL